MGCPDWRDRGIAIVPGTTIFRVNEHTRCACHYFLVSGIFFFFFGVGLIDSLRATEMSVGITGRRSTTKRTERSEHPALTWIESDWLTTEFLTVGGFYLGFPSSPPGTHLHRLSQTQTKNNTF